MDRKLWENVKDIVSRCLDADPGEQRARIMTECSGDPSLIAEVESLLASYHSVGDFLEPTALEEDEDVPPGTQLGSYRIHERIAEGGMGAVYRALRCGDFQKQVAIKMVKRGMDTQFVLRRFHRERQILAALDHPNIARLLDGGATADGRPYLVMDYVEGTPVTDYAERRGLTICQRLELFVAICSAVQYSHQNLVVHRDLKPGNILVTPSGAPKVLDFGIAKLLEPNDDATLTSLRLLTPECASPEQVRGEAITAATDIYALGVLLYQLLTGEHPYQFTTRTPEEIRRVVCETQPRKPSAVRRVPEDLDNIVLKAMHPEASRRYASAEQLSEDIRRHLHGLPVTARRDTFWYRARKLVGRHRTASAATGLLVLSLLAGTAATLWEAHVARVERARAERRLSDVRQLAHSLLEIHDAMRNSPGSTPARKLLVSGALQYLDGLGKETAKDPALERELADAYEKAGDVQGNPENANLGDTAGALESYRKAFAIRRSLAALLPGAGEARRGLAVDYMRIGILLRLSGDLNGGLRNAREALAIFQSLAGDGRDGEAQDELAGAYFEVAQCLADLGDWRGALASYQRSASIRETIGGDSPAHHLKVQTRLAGDYGYMSGVFAAQRDFGQALEMQRRALDILRRLSAADPGNATSQEYIHESEYWSGTYFEQKGDFANAIASYRRAMSGFTSLASADPREARAKRYRALCYKGIGGLLVTRGELVLGLESLHKALPILQTLADADPAEHSEKPTDLADAYSAIGRAYAIYAAQPGIAPAARTSRWREARSAYRKSLDIWMDLKRLGAGQGVSGDEPARVAAELAQCDTALAKLNLNY